MSTEMAARTHDFGRKIAEDVNSLLAADLKV
jgi:hypothetical protein